MVPLHSQWHLRNIPPQNCIAAKKERNLTGEFFFPFLCSHLNFGSYNIITDPFVCSYFLTISYLKHILIIIMSISIKWHDRVHSCTSFSFPAIPIFNTRKKVEVIKVLAKETNLESESNAKKANLCAAKKERIKLPNFDDGFGGKNFHISEFLSHPSGTEAMLNTRALKKYEPLSTDTYRCTLPKLKLLNFEAAPVLDLRVNPTNEDCMVEMLSCKFEGSEAVERQNSRFSALMTNHMSWGTDDSESFLEVDVKLKLTLEIYTRPFTMMPVSAVERPGNLMMQALLDKLVPLLLQQLIQDYNQWIQEQLDHLP